MRHGSLFSGIGGFDLAAEWMGWENIFHVENNEFCKKILNKHWPNAICYGDITKTDFTQYYKTIDIITGGFPCQPFSTAGKRMGTEDNRYLWPEMLRAIREIQPNWIVGENVHGIVNWSKGLVFDKVQTDLENEGYKSQTYVLPACSKNAPHERYRAWFVAYSMQRGSQTTVQRFGEIIQLHSEPPNRFNRFASEQWKISKRDSGDLRRCDGIPNWVDRIGGLGNAIVPQVAYEIFKAIEKYNQQ